MMRVQLMTRAGDLAGAKALASQLAEAARAGIDPALRGLMLATQASVLLQCGEADAALANLKEAVELSAGAPQEPSVRHNYGALLMRCGDLPGAEREFRALLETGPATRRGRLRSNVLGTLANACLYQDRAAEAEPLFQAAMLVAREIGMAVEEAKAAADLSGYYIDTMRLAEADELLQLVRTTALEQDDPRLRRAFMVNSGFIRWRQGRTAEAENLFRAVVEDARAASDLQTVATGQSALAIMLVEVRRQDARELWNGVVSDLRKHGTPQVIASRNADMQRACTRAGIAPFDAA
jgi:tetratricopeptide (TPR) repeat protein